MKQTIYSLTGILILLLLVYCASDEQVGSISDYSDCKTFSEKKNTLGHTQNEDCMEYKLNSDGILYLKHINAGFNCCPGELFADIEVVDDTIFITEKQARNGCKCLCLYDIDYRVENIEAQTYFIKVDELLVDDNEKQLAFTVDLKIKPTGSFCVYRSNYPWDIPAGISVQLDNHTACKSFTKKSADEYSSGDDAFEFEYKDGTLHCRRINAGFNCCPDGLSVDVELYADTVFIYENENDGLCDCLCLYDLNYQINGLSESRYTIKISEPYLQDDEKPLTFDINLQDSLSGYYTVKRDFYPWGL